MIDKVSAAAARRSHGVDDPAALLLRPSVLVARRHRGARAPDSPLLLAVDSLHFGDDGCTSAGADRSHVVHEPVEVVGSGFLEAPVREHVTESRLRPHFGMP